VLNANSLIHKKRQNLMNHLKRIRFVNIASAAKLETVSSFSSFSTASQWPFPVFVKKLINSWKREMILSFRETCYETSLHVLHVPFPHIWQTITWVLIGWENGWLTCKVEIISSYQNHQWAKLFHFLETSIRTTGCCTAFYASRRKIILSVSKTHLQNRNFA